MGWIGKIKVINNANEETKLKNSSYADWAEELARLGFDCSNLTDDQMDEIGMAYERADLEWHWASVNEKDWRKGSFTREYYAARITEAKIAVAACGAETLNEMVCLYVGGIWDDLRLER